VSSRWRSRYLIPQPSAAELLFKSTVAQIDANLARGDTRSAQCAALEWADAVSDRLSLERVCVWKYFKRNLVERWFGGVERKRFAPGWTIDDIVGYADQFCGTQMRMSFFTQDIACHAESVRLPMRALTERRKFIEQFENSCAIEVFPESSGPHTICFRRFTSEFGEDVFYEAAYGQAMKVFETEQGRHVIACAVKTTKGYHYTLSGRRPRGAEGSAVLANLLALIRRHDLTFDLRAFSLCRMVGIEHFSIEGYFTKHLDRVVVVDIDLPLDGVFMRIGASR